MMEAATMTTRVEMSENAMSDLLTDDDRWQAVLARDLSHDGQFYTAVLTTGIYCRPSCAARHPKRENVRFYATLDEAREAGFRPCRRCHPDEAHSQIDLAQRVCEYLDTIIDERVTLDDLGARFHVSPFHLQRTFKRIVGVSPRQYADARRRERLKSELRDGCSITRAALEAGYTSISQLAADPLGMTPTAYQRGGENTRIRYSTIGTSLGVVLIAATERGVCAITIGDSPDDLYDALAAEFPAAVIDRDDSGLGLWAATVLAYIDGEARTIDLPLDVRATAFQRRVWEALRAIPAGETRSYSQIAQVIGQPTAARAVARACATNPAAMIIPCHRVIREDGDRGGYKWGLLRKHALLEIEARQAG
jgi:AraC family transcriptional regulator of adaptative response/methylated-DNA-[protein]-cysteine methyltransferase